MLPLQEDRALSPSLQGEAQVPQQRRERAAGALGDDGLRQLHPYSTAEYYYYYYYAESAAYPESAG